MNGLPFQQSAARVEVGEERGGQGYDSLLGTHFPFRRKSPTSPCQSLLPQLLSCPVPTPSSPQLYNYCATIVLQKLQDLSHAGGTPVSMVPRLILNLVDA
ncbi:hypothetical protein Pcinc_029559 [Petrolisthes cinctipes]|uniref:Uncharacterized protein n=1 Tax=Petrolisthes cinctipes TaxID=88211 RepID=A0AAE1EZU5_PETCI|nr:hypothetical protein Pcinc_029559 [Petrolisthes cinctipes]